jgi:hypothetical protein
MTFDLVIAITLTAAAAVMIGTLAASIPAPASNRVGFAAAFAVWFFAVVAIAGSGLLQPDQLGTRGVGVAVALPIIAIVVLAMRWQPLRNAALGIPLPVLLGVNAVRLLGVFFVMLYAAGRLPAPFAPSAGWGDIAVGATALPVAYFAARRTNGWRPVAFLWSVVGLADLVMAVGLGVTSAVDSPLRLFTEGPGTALMAALPMFLIPGFLVPLLALTHLAVLARLPRASIAHTIGPAAT